MTRETKMDKKTLDEAKRLAARLAAAADDLNDALRSAEEAFKALGLGVVAEVPFPVTRFPDTALGFGKYDKTWCFTVRHGSNSYPLVNASRELRLVAVDLIPALASKLVAVAEAETGRVEARTGQVWDLVDQLVNRNQ
jgi:hypothetical protein